MTLKADLNGRVSHRGWYSVAPTSVNSCSHTDQRTSHEATRCARSHRRARARRLRRRRHRRRRHHRPAGRHRGTHRHRGTDRYRGARRRRRTPPSARPARPWPTACSTIATGDPAFPPYVIDDAPESGEGFEAAVALAVAEQMGFTGEAVTWVRTGFDEPSLRARRTSTSTCSSSRSPPSAKQTVSFSTPYYTANQAVLGYADGPAAGVTKLSDLKTLKLGAAAATTSLSFITEVIQPDVEPFAFNSNADAKTALDNQQIDAIITDLPTGLFISAVEIEGTKVFGQFPIDAGGAGDELGPAVHQGQPARRVRQPGARRADRQRRAGRDPGSVDGRVQRGAHARRGLTLPGGPSRASSPRLVHSAHDRPEPGRRPRVGARARRGTHAPAALPACPTTAIADHRRAQHGAGRRAAGRPGAADARMGTRPQELLRRRAVRRCVPRTARVPLGRRQAVPVVRADASSSGGSSSRCAATAATRRCSRCGCSAPSTPTCSAACPSS